MPTLRSSGASLLLTALLVLVPLFAFFEQSAARVWAERLFMPDYIDEPDRHTPRVTQGTYLPPLVTSDTTLDPARGPFLIKDTVRVAPEAHLTIPAGTQIYVHEFGTLLVEGTVSLAGTADAPITFKTNEVHPENYVWGGVFFAAGSRGTISHTRIEDASPAISCLGTSRIQVSDVRVLRSEVGMFISSPTCTVRDSTIAATRVGVVLVNLPQWEALGHTVITAGQQATAHYPVRPEL